MSLIKCKECGKEYSSNASACPKCGNPSETASKKAKDENEKETSTVAVDIVEKPTRKWATAKLIIAIISMVLFIIIGFQSCAAGLGNILSNNGSDSGTSGFMCALFTLIGGIITMATRNSTKKGGTITAIVFYWLGAFFTVGSGDTYPDLPVWGSIAFSFGLVDLGSLLVESKKIEEPKKQKIVLIAVIVISIVVFFISLTSGGKKLEQNNNKPNTNTNSSVNEDTNEDANLEDNSNVDNTLETKKDGVYALGETFIFRELEITLGTKISFSKVNNRYSEQYKKAVIKVPITIKNLKDETQKLSSFDFSAFGSKGIEVDALGYYFNDSVEKAGELRTGASYTKYLYILYDGDGLYAIEFDDWSKKITVEFDIKK